jgi:hypothetical protein
MQGRIESGQKVTVSPVDPKTLKIDDIVLCTIKGKHFLHLVKEIDQDRFLIGNNKGSINGWTRQIHGILTRTED